MPKENQINQGQVEAWKVIEVLAMNQFDLMTIPEIGRATGYAESKVRRILITWDQLGLVEKRGENCWRLSQYLTHDLPGRLMLQLSGKFLSLSPISSFPKIKGEKNAEEEK